MASCAWAEIIDEAAGFCLQTPMHVDFCHPYHGRSRYVEGSELTLRTKNLFITASRCTSQLRDWPSQAHCQWRFCLVTPISHHICFNFSSLVLSNKESTHIYSTLSLPFVLVAFFSGDACLWFVVSHIQRRNCVPGHNVPSLFCYIYPSKRQWLKEQIAWIYKLYYR